MKSLLNPACATIALALTNCTSVQQFTLRDTSQMEESRARSSVFVRGTVTHQMGRQNLTLRENLQWGAPAYPEEGWKQDMTIRIDEVLKGKVNQDSISLRDLGPISMFPDSGDPWPYLDAKEYYIGWHRQVGPHFSRLILIPLR